MNIRNTYALAALVAALAALQTYGGFSKEKFRTPENVFSPAYFWMWNTRLDPAHLNAQLDDMFAHGMRSICIHPFPKDFRAGTFQSEMEPDYLSDGYFLVFSNVVEHAAALGMNVWLYDEGGWPSGGACGKVAAADSEGRFRKRFAMPGADAAAPKVVAAPYGPRRDAYPSITEKGTTEEFLRLTHCKYAKYVGHHFGRAIKFTFMDEPSMPTCSAGSHLAWTADFEDVFKNARGYDIAPYVNRIVTQWQTPDKATSTARIDYFDTMADVFVSRFMDPIRKWDHAHGLLSSGHLNGEDIPEAAARYGYGALLRSYRAMDIPGVDVIWRQLFPETDGAEARTAPFPRYASSVAHQKGEMRTLSESFGIFGNSFTPDQMRWLVDFQLLRGVNMFVFGYYSVSNERQWMLLFEPHSGPATPWWDMERPFFEYIARTGSILADGQPTAEIAVYFDSRAFWAGDASATAAGEMHYAVSSALDKMNCEYEFVDDDAIAAADVRNGRLHVGRMSYTTLVLPTSRFMRNDSRSKVDAFKAQGGKVLAPDDLSDARPVCRIRYPHAKMLRAAKRVNGDETLYYIVNESRWKLDDVRLEFDENGTVSQADPETGDFVAVDRKPDGSVEWSFPPYGSSIFVVGAKPDRPAPPSFDTKNVQTLSQGWTVRRLAAYTPEDEDFAITAVDEPPTPAELGDWRTLFGNSFSGKALYSCRFKSDRACKALLDLGKVGWTCRATLNGKELQQKFFGPFRWTVDLEKGENLLEVTVANMLANAMSDFKTRARISAKYPPSTTYEPKQRAYDLENHESGLIGPVTLATEPVTSASL